MGACHPRFLALCSARCRDAASPHPLISFAALAQLVRALDCGSRGPPFNPERRYHFPPVPIIATGAALLAHSRFWQIPTSAGLVRLVDARDPATKHNCAAWFAPPSGCFVKRRRLTTRSCKRRCLWPWRSRRSGTYAHSFDSQDCCWRCPLGPDVGL